MKTKGYDVIQLMYAKIVNVPMSYLNYKDYHVKVKTKFFYRNIVINACCIEHLMQICEDKGYDILTINTLE